MVTRYDLLGIGVLFCALGCGESPDGGIPGSSGSTAGGASGNSGSSPGGGGGAAGTTAGDGGSGGTAGGSASGSGGGGSGGQGGGAPEPATAFEPDVPNTYVGTIAEPGMEVVAHGVRNPDSSRPEWLMAVKNTGTDHLCAIDVQYTFLDAADAELGSGFRLLEIPLERGSNGTGGLTNCLAPGKIGMLADTIALIDVDVAQIAKVTHEFGAIILVDAVPTDDIKVVGVQATPGDFGGNVFTGSIQNDSTVPVENPSIVVFGVNAAGRPLFASEAIELTTIPAGGSWSFETAPEFEETFDSFVAYPDVSD